MKKWIIFCIIFLQSPVYLALGRESDKLDPHLKVLQRLSGDSVSGKGVFIGKNTQNGTVEPNDQKVVGVFIKTRNVETLKIFLSQNAGKINSIIGDIVTAQIPLDIVATLKNVEGVVYVELAQPVKTNLNVSRILIGADQVQNGSSFPAVGRDYTGRDVIVGIVDTGIDWQHVTFKDGSNGSRVKFIWDQSLSSSEEFIAPREITNTYGLECVGRDLDLAGYSLCPSSDRDGHGTHVAGIAAGGDTTFKGIAPGSEIIAVKIPEAEGVAGDYTYDIGLVQSFSNHVIDGVNYIFQKAAALGMPAVVNLSLGSHFGPHDSTSLFEQALNNLAAGAPGRGIVVAAGNEANISGSYFASIHAGFSLQDETKAIEFVSKSTLLHSLILDIWQPADSNLSFGIGVDDYKNYQKTPMIAPGGSITFSTADGELNILVDSSETQNPLNGKKHTLVYIVASRENDGVAVAASKYVFDLIVSGNGSFDAWIALGGTFTKRTGELSHTGFIYQGGDSQRTIGVPATASKVLTVASYVSRNNQSDLDNIVSEGWLPDISSLVEGNVSSFSSLGPTVNSELTGQKPEIAAPGEWVMSAMSSASKSKFESQGWPRTYGNVLLAGTSMAAPHVAGTIALMFEQHRSLTADDIKRRLFLTVDSGQAVGITPVPNNRLGYGKLNAERAMRYDDFASSGYDFSSRVLSVSLETVPETSYDGGATDLANSGLVSSVVSQRGRPLNTNVLETNSADTPSQDPLQDPLEPSSGGCSLVVSQNSANSSSLFFLFFSLVLLFLFRSRGHFLKLSLVAVALFWFSGCGGGGGSGTPLQDEVQNNNQPAEANGGTPTGSTSPDAQNAPLNLLTSLDLSKEQGQVFFQEGWVATVTVNTDRTKQFVLFMPFKHLFVGEAVPLGADGLYGFNPDEGFLVIYEGRNLGDSNAQITGTYVATSGTFSLSEAFIRQGEKLSGSFQVNQITPVDLSTRLIQRGKEQVTLSSSFSATVEVGGTSDPRILEYTPTSVQKGGEVTLKGLNLRDVQRVWFKNCDINSPLPFQVVSDNILKINISQFSCKIKESISISNSTSTFPYTSFSTAEEFEIQIPYLQNFSSPGIYLNSGSMIYDTSRQFVYIEDATDARLRVFSMLGNKFLTTAYSSFANLYERDITSDGGTLAFFNNYSANRMTLFNMAGIGETADLNATILNLSSIPYATGYFFLGKGRKGLVGTTYGLKLVDLNTGAFTSLPSTLSSNFYSGYDSLFRSQNREYIILNMGSSNPYAGAATTIYHALVDGEFEKVSSAMINKKILGVAEVSQELWSVDSIFDLNLVQQGSYGTGIPDWNASTAIGIVFDPSNTYAILISNKGVIHILDRVTKAILATNVPVINIQNKTLLNQFVLSNDAIRLLLSSEGYLHSIDINALFESLGLSL